MNYRSYEDLSLLIMANISLIPKDVDLIVGIPRSGLLVANIIALILNKPLTDLEGLGEGRLISSGHTKNTSMHINSVEQSKKILVVDDSMNFGNTLEFARDRIKSFCVECDVIYLVAYSTKQSLKKADIVLEVLPQPRVFEWNIFHVKVVSKTCFDMDGVLCEDPSELENDDGERYLEFIRNAKAKIIPTKKIGAIVTSRLEKYRYETEEWLKKNGIEYGELIMLDSTAEERRTFGLHFSFKAGVYSRSEYTLFIESDSIQAKKINEISKKPVYCVNDGCFYDGSGSHRLKESISNKKMLMRLKLKKYKFINKLNQTIKKIKG